MTFPASTVVSSSNDGITNHLSTVLGAEQQDLWVLRELKKKWEPLA
jgi:hypothetical protein